MPHARSAPTPICLPPRHHCPTCGAMEWKSRLARRASCQASYLAYMAWGCQASPAAASGGTGSGGGSGSTLQAGRSGCQAVSGYRIAASAGKYARLPPASSAARDARQAGRQAARLTGTDDRLRLPSTTASSCTSTRCRPAPGSRERQSAKRSSGGLGCQHQARAASRARAPAGHVICSTNPAAAEPPLSPPRRTLGQQVDAAAAHLADLGHTAHPAAGSPGAWGMWAKSAAAPWVPWRARHGRRWSGQGMCGNGMQV